MGHYPTSAVIKWTEVQTPESSANISMEYQKGTLNMGIVLSGTPTIPNGTACIIYAQPLNCELKSGESIATKEIPSGMLNTTIMLNVTPSSAYKGKWVNYLVSITAHKDSVFTAKVGW